MIRFFILLASLCLLGGCSVDRYVEWETVPPESFPKLTAIGYAPLAGQPAKSQAERVMMAMQASKLAAYRELAEQVYGQKITATSSVNEWSMGNDSIKASVSGVIRGARVVRSYPEGEHYVTELELDFSRVWAISQQHNRPQRIKDVTYF